MGGIRRAGGKSGEPWDMPLFFEDPTLYFHFHFLGSHFGATQLLSQCVDRFNSLGGGVTKSTFVFVAQVVRKTGIAGGEGCGCKSAVHGATVRAFHLYGTLLADRATTVRKVSDLSHSVTVASIG